MNRKAFEERLREEKSHIGFDSTDLLKKLNIFSQTLPKPCRNVITLLSMFLDKCCVFHKESQFVNFNFREIKMSPYDAELYDRYSSQVGSIRIH